MRLSFDQRVALVTGAGHIIGNAVAAALSQSGAIVHVADTPDTGLEERALIIGARPHVCDVSRRHEAHEVVRGVLETEGRLDIVINAGRAGSADRDTALEDVDELGITSVIGHGTDATFWLAQACAPTMKRAGFGRIVTVASPSGETTGTGLAAVQQALMGLTRQLSSELGPHGVTVNAVLAGPMSTEPAFGNGFSLAVPHARRAGRPEDIASAALFLSSDEAGWISGQVLPVDGGRS